MIGCDTPGYPAHPAPPHPITQHHSYGCRSGDKPDSGKIRKQQTARVDKLAALLRVRLDRYVQGDHDGFKVCALSCSVVSTSSLL